MADNGAPWPDHGLEFARKDFEPFVETGAVRVWKLWVADIVAAFYEVCGEKELPVLRGTTVPDSVEYEEAFRHGDILGGGASLAFCGIAAYLLVIVTSPIGGSSVETGFISGAETPLPDHRYQTTGTQIRGTP